MLAPLPLSVPRAGDPLGPRRGVGVRRLPPRLVKTMCDAVRLPRDAYSELAVVCLAERAL